MKYIQINDEKIGYKMRRSKRAKRMRMQMESDKTLTIVLPTLMPQFAATNFLNTNKKWVEAQLKKIEIKHIAYPPHKYKEGETFFYLGEKYKLTYKPHKLKRAKLKIEGDVFVVYLYEKVKEAEGFKQAKKVVEDFYKKKATEIVHDRLQYFNDYYKHKYNKVTLRNQKSRWGSCSALKNLNFNWRLSMAPIEIIDYVIVHELCHLKQMNHSQKFWDLVAKTIPDHKEKRKWLKDNHFMLKI